MEVQVVKQLKCKRCGHEWSNRKTTVRVCPHCHSPYFDKERENKTVQKEVSS